MGGGDSPSRSSPARGSCRRIIVVDGPAVSGPALLLGRRRPRRDDRVQLRVRQRPGDGRGVHRRAGDERRARRRLKARPAHRVSRASSWRLARRPSMPSAVCSPTCRRASTTSRPAGRPTTRSIGGVPSRRARSRRPPPAATTSAVSPPAIRRCRLPVRGARTVGRQRGHGVAPRSPADRSASSPISRCRWPARSTSPASQKAARFVAFCDAFNLPILTLVDTPGFYPGKDLAAVDGCHGAQLVFAYGRATVPWICVILRKSYGGAYIVMDSKRMGNDLCLAWPWAELAVMGAGAGGGRYPAAAGDARGTRRCTRPTTPSDCSTRSSPPSVATSTPSSIPPRRGRGIAVALDALA